MNLFGRLKSIISIKTYYKKGFIIKRIYKSSKGGIKFK